MLYHLLYPLSKYFSGFNVFKYITFRSAGAVLTALVVSFIFGKPVIAWLRRLKVGQHVRDDGPKTHLSKQGTPTMGGILIILALVVSSVLWSDLTNQYVWVVLFAAVAFGGIGFRRARSSGSRLPLPWWSGSTCTSFPGTARPRSCRCPS
jgi:phospho-N-acetylmuramoyl-pentapeptide-transferase